MPIPRCRFIARMDQEEESSRTGSTANASSPADAITRIDSENLTLLGGSVEIKSLDKDSVSAVVDRAAAMKTNDPNSFSDRNENNMEECASNSKKKRYKNKKAFTEKLMEALSQDDSSHAITWLPNGKMFEVVNPTKLVEDILPRYFQQTKFDSFDRKLRRWGFKRVVRAPNALIYQHPMFLRDKPEICRFMRSAYMESQESSAESKSAESGSGNNNSEEIEDSKGKLSAQCDNKDTTHMSEKGIAQLLEEQDRIVSNLKNSIMLHTQNKTRIPLAYMEAQNAALRKQMFAQFQARISLQQKVAATVAMQAQNTALPSFLRDVRQPYGAAPQISTPHIRNELASYIHKKMGTIHARYANALHAASPSAAAQNPCILSSQAQIGDCAKFSVNTRNTIPLKQSGHGSSGLSGTPNSNYAHTA